MDSIISTKLVVKQMRKVIINVVLFILVFFIMPYGSSQPKTLIYSNNQIGKIESVNETSSTCSKNNGKKKTVFCCDKYKVGELIVSRSNKKNKEIWKKSLSVLNFHINFEGLQEDKNKNIYVLASFYDNTNYTSGFCIVKMNRRGNVLWSKIFKLSEDLSQQNSSNIVHLSSNNELILVNKSFIKNTNSGNLSQISLFKFNENGEKILEVSTEVNKQIIGTSIDKSNQICFLGSNSESQSFAVDYLVNLDNVIKKIKSINTNSFQLANLDFNENLQLSDTLRLKEMSFFHQFETKQDVDFIYISGSESRLLKCKFVNGNKIMSQNLFQDFDASIDGEQNLWEDNKSLNYINGNAIYVQIENHKKKRDSFKYQDSKTGNIKKNKSELYIIQDLSDEIKKIVLVKTLYLKTSKSFDN